MYIITFFVQVYSAQLRVSCYRFLNPRSQRQDGHSDLRHPLWPVDAQVDQRVQEEDNCWKQGTQVKRWIFSLAQFSTKCSSEGLRLKIFWWSWAAWRLEGCSRGSLSRLNTALGLCLITAGGFSSSLCRLENKGRKENIKFTNRYHGTASLFSFLFISPPK